MERCLGTDSRRVPFVADRGDGVYLGDVSGGVCQVADTKQGSLFPRVRMAAIAGRG